MGLDKLNRFVEIQQQEGLSSALSSTWSYLSSHSPPIYLWKLDNKIKRYDLENPEGVVLLPMIPGYTDCLYRQAVIGHAFKIRGYKPIYLFNDGVLPICPSNTVNSDDNECRKSCSNLPPKLSSKFNATSETLSENIQRDVEEYKTLAKTSSSPTFTYDGNDLTPFVQSSLRRYYKRHHIEDLSKYDSDVWNGFCTAAMMIKDATENLLSKYDVEVIVAFEETYIQGGIPLFCGEQAGISGYSVDWGYKAQDLAFGRTANRQYLAWFSDTNLLSEIVDTPLTTEQKNVIDETMSQRMEGINTKSDYVSYDAASVDVGGFDTVVGLFTNLIWDASLEAKEGAYSDPFEWLETTLDWFESNPDELLVIKTHPAEGKHGTNQQVSTWIRDYCGTLPENIILLEPDSEVNPYEMIRDIDVGIVYNSIIGLEMAYEGIPVIVAGDPHYRDLGFTHDATNPDDYTEYLDELSQGFDTSSTERLARRYAHYFFERKHIPVEFYESEGTYSRKKYPITHDELAGEPYETIVQQMLNGEPVHFLG
ncbi:hypothetical protein OB919_20940 [Halobacteria archaeon AArc-curdl1]|uniref:Capsule polysaccharide biosynthesis protein n=1 Tax=Natronosalvus hydrolyticus TaxID=2979988 RepID=A0AAP3E866_9EURY|nr:hypothetical protein [Halobacteria archaeon AArc-curdl1]